MLTEDGYTRQHLENVTNILEGANAHVCNGIAQMRGLRNIEDPLTWKLVHDHGTFTADDAKKMGFVDYTPQLDPLEHLIDSTKNEAEKSQLKLGKDTDFHTFQATSAIELPQYISLLSKRKKMEERRWKIHAMLKDLAEKSTATSVVLQAMGFKRPFYNIDEVCTEAVSSVWRRLYYCILLVPLHRLTRCLLSHGRRTIRKKRLHR